MNIIYPDLEKKIILVTGVTGGIGAEIISSLARQKAHIVFNYRPSHHKAIHTLVEKLKSLGAIGVDALPFDITHEEQMEEQLLKFMKTAGPITGLVNNAGISKDQMILRLKKTDIAKTIDTNLIAPIMLTKILSRGFLKSKAVSIVNISSIVGLMGNASQIAYSASKAGLIGFTKSLAKELGSKNIRCNAICPGFIQTDMTENLDDKLKKMYLSQIALKRFGKGEEVSDLINFLLSQASRYITGEYIKVDGGLYI